MCFADLSGHNKLYNNVRKVLKMKVNYEDFNRLNDLNKWLIDNKNLKIINIESTRFMGIDSYRVWFFVEVN